jgi:hypothetical protein
VLLSVTDVVFSTVVLVVFLLSSAAYPIEYHNELTMASQGETFPKIGQGQEYVAIIHDSLVEAYLKSSTGPFPHGVTLTKQENRLRATTATAYQTQLQRIMQPDNNGVISSDQFCAALDLEINDYRQAVTKARDGNESAEEKAAYNRALNNGIEMHEMRGNINRHCVHHLRGVISGLFS